MNSIAQATALAIVLLLVHLVEEIATGFRERIPCGPMPRWLFITLSVALYGFCLCTLVLTARNQPAGLVMAWILSAVVLLNGLGHLIAMLVRRQYSPGGLTAVLLPFAAAILMDNLLR